jgi:D-alanyl-D-alanine carboxypeptidase
VDLISTKNVVLDETFADNPAYAWLTENAHNFGFILRYPKGDEATTGYSYEPWHYRFVGVEAATRIREKGWTLEEYTD